MYLIALKKRLLDKTTVLDNGCWYCSAGGEESRYGTIWHDGHNISNHVASWLVHNGAVPQGLCVLHHCDYMRCVNPEHLFLGTLADNNTDRHNKGRSDVRIGELNPSAKLTEFAIREIRKMLEEGYAPAFIAEQFGVTRVTISQIKTGKRWSHVR